MRKVDLPEDIEGKLLLHSMPGCYETWDDFIDQAKEHGVKQIFCLTHFEEIKEKSPDYAAAITNEKVPFEKVDLPIEDFGTPNDKARFVASVISASISLEAGHTIIIHCAEGIGRTGTFASCVLQLLGQRQDEAVAHVERAGSGAETNAQRQLISKFAESITT